MELNTEYPDYQEFMRICTASKNPTAARELSEQEREFAKRVREAMDQFVNVKKDRGVRYENCRFENYQVSCENQKRAVEKLKAYALNSKNEINDGRNVIVFGGKGTGKDHLLTALARECVKASAPMVHWLNGIELIEQWRAHVADRGFHTYRGYSHSNSSERTCDVLWLSDPIPPSGSLSDYLQSKMFELVDYRYSQKLPIWITCNVADASELSERLGSQATDRLREDCLPVFCDWPSFRTGE